MSSAAAVSAMVLLSVGETHLDAADVARGRWKLPQERRVLTGRKFLLANLGGPFRDFLAALVSERDDHGRDVNRGGAGIDHVALDLEHGLASFVGPAVTDA